MIARLILLVLASGLAGCAGTAAQDGSSQPKANAAWRNSLGEATFVTLVPGETRTFRITPEQQTYGFPEGISYFVGIALPPSDRPRKLTLRTLVDDPIRKRDTHVFVPRVAVIAPDGKVARYVEPEFQPSERPAFLARNAGWESTLTLDSGETRLAVYTSTLLPQTLRLPLPTEPGSYWYVPSGPTGVVEITFSKD
jgi:hypothetical protein